MASFATIYAAATDAASSLRKQVAVAISIAAINVINENAGDFPNHGQRLEWALKMKQDGLAVVLASERWIWAVLDNPTIAADPTAALDNDVQFVVNGLVDTMARAG